MTKRFKSIIATLTVSAVAFGAGLGVGSFVTKEEAVAKSEVKPIITAKRDPGGT
ncbi:hypothetical protein [Priestia flexa]|uniref:hypothetical protein n=1 Tax=Priestia flexa TaxID=86664 RepID=UPI003D05CF0B